MRSLVCLCADSVVVNVEGEIDKESRGVVCMVGTTVCLCNMLDISCTLTCTYLGCT